MCVRVFVCAQPCCFHNHKKRKTRITYSLNRVATTRSQTAVVFVGVGVGVRTRKQSGNGCAEAPGEAITLLLSGIHYSIYTTMHTHVAHTQANRTRAHSGSRICIICRRHCATLYLAGARLQLRAFTRRIVVQECMYVCGCVIAV